jgi:uncharacterized protein with HEPN domain
MTRAVELYISDILQQMEDALEFVQGMTYEQFVRDKKTINAVLRSIEVIGEAAKNVPESIRVSGYTLERDGWYARQSHSLSTSELTRRLSGWS